MASTMLSQFEAMILIDSKVMLQSKFANLPFIMALRDAGASKKSYCNLKKLLDFGIFPWTWVLKSIYGAVDFGSI